MNAELTKELRFICKVILISMMIGSCITAMYLYQSPQIVYHANNDRCDTNKYHIISNLDIPEPPIDYNYEISFPVYYIEPPYISFDNTAEHGISPPPIERELNPYQLTLLPPIDFDPPPKP